jgi:hypothetical protein
MDLRHITRFFCIVFITYALPIFLGWHLYSENPQGLLLYTPPPYETNPKYSPAFLVGAFVGLIATSIISALLVFLSLVTSRLSKNIRLREQAKSLAKASGVSLAASLAGVAVCAMQS